ncbi:hypothetical protein [Halorussus sp. AFM4]|uniref:hypothetical protein n=1 Tax=Halorussus sp. AFM4 TaxID=3421651 RepID=UPI003EBFB645
MDLVDYFPDYISQPCKYVRASVAIQGIIDDEGVFPRDLPGTEYTAYLTDEDDPPTLGARSIANSIKFYDLPSDHSFHPNNLHRRLANDELKEDDKLNGRDSNLIKEYSRIRGAAAHSLYTASVPESDNEDFLNDLNDIYDVNNPLEMYESVYEWPGSNPLMTRPDLLQVIDDSPTEALYQSCKDGAWMASDNWDAARREHKWRVLVTEGHIIVEIDGIRYCARPDQIVYIDGSPTLPPGLYTIDAKAVTRLKPDHILQAEAQRRAISSRVADNADVHAIILKLSGAERGEWKIFSSLNDDDWLPDQAWDMFYRRAKTMYEDAYIRTKLRQLAHDAR